LHVYQYPAQRCGERHRIVAISGSVVGDPVKVRVSAERRCAPVQPSGRRDSVNVGEHRVHGESGRRVITQDGQVLLGGESCGFARLRDEVEYQYSASLRVHQRTGQGGNEQMR
jgi:hypothetical protein